jgi:hypothetical protein
VSLAGCLATAPEGPALQPDKAVFGTEQPTLADLWDGRAHFAIDVADTGLPMGESDTVTLGDGLLWSYIHASHQSAGVIDQCGDPVPFPGCVVLLQSRDGGRDFTPLAGSDAPLVCQFECLRCPCDSKRDHIDQQQYPQVARITKGDGTTEWTMVYEYRASVMVRRSPDGLQWTPAEEVPLTGIWQRWLMPCADHERIGPHPAAPPQYDCLVGSPPGVTLARNERGEAELYLFVGLGQNPGHMGCYRGAPGSPAATWRKCSHNPLFVGATEYGPTTIAGPAANPYFDFRTISSADVIQVDDRHYMLYEGVRGPAPGDDGDTQFALGLARSLTDQIDGPWETFPGNPILVDLPGNVGLGHGDLIVLDGRTYLYTSLDGVTRGRMVLRWNE